MKEICGVLGLCTQATTEALYALRDFSASARNLDVDLVRFKLEERARARADKDWARSDTIRDELLAVGVELRDGPGGTDWKVVRS